MPLSEADTRAKLIDPALHARGWTEDLIRREETAGAVDVLEGRARRRARGRTDYTLRVKVSTESQPVAVALIEAKAVHLPPGHGLEQAKAYGTCQRLNVAFCFSSNGHLFVEFDRLSGLTTSPRPLAEFPAPAELRARYELSMGFSLAAPEARPLVTRYAGGEEGTRRYYQDAAVRAVLEKLARGEKRALLSLATGAGKTRIAVNLLKRIGDAGQLRRALFVCDRDELRSQGLGAFQNVFGADAAAVSSDHPQKNARILVATYQTLDVDTEEANANFLTTHYPENYFSHIVIDECHRSAWGKEFKSRFTPPRRELTTPGPATPAPPPERTIQVEGFDVRVSDAGRYIVTMVDGRAMPVTVDEYKQRVAERLVAEAPSLERFRSCWIAPAERRDLLGRLPDAGRSALLVRALEDMTEYDLYDVLAELGYGLAPRTREHRTEAFGYKHAAWLAGLPPAGAATLSALARQFARAGTDGLESPEVFQTPEVARAGGIRALRALGRPADILRETKERLLAA